MLGRWGWVILVAGAIGVPVGLWAIARARVAAAAEALGRLTGAPVRVGDGEVGLDGTLHFTDVAVGALATAEAVDAAIGLESLLAGRFAADEIVVSRPRVRIDAAGAPELTRLLGKGAGKPAGGAGNGARRLRRIVMQDGEVTVDLGERGALRVRDIEIQPQESGVRVVLGPTDGELRFAGLTAGASFARGGLDIDFPGARPGRAALDGGKVTISAPGQPPLLLDRVVVVRGAATRIEGALAGGGRLAVVVGAGGVATVDAEKLPLAPFAPALPPWLVPGGELSGQARLHIDGPVIEASAKVSGAGLAVRHALLAAVAVPLDGRIDARLRWNRDTRTGGGTIGIAAGALAVEADLALALGEGDTVRSAGLEARMPAIACADALAALPAPLRAPLDGLDLTGTLAGRAAVSFDAARPDDTRLDLDLEVGCSVVRDASTAQVDLLAGAYTHRLPDGKTRILGRADPDYLPLASLPELVPAAFVAAEDSRFFQHHGFDTAQLRHSLAVDMSAGRVERGGSTISQQLVKNLYLGRERTLARKLVEAIVTWRLESRVPKNRILEAYLNVIELGGGAYGVGPAARRWFGKPAAKLSPAEIAYLAAVTAAPATAERCLRETGRPDPDVLRRAHLVLGNLRSRLGSDGLAEASRKLDALAPL